MKQTDFVVTLFEGKENPDNLTVAVVMALNAIKQGHSATIILMVKAVALGQPGAANGVCNSCMEHNGFRPEQMDPRYVLINAPDVVSLLMGAKGSLQIT